MEFYVAMKNNKLLIPESQRHMLSEKSNTKDCIISFIGSPM